MNKWSPLGHSASINWAPTMCPRCWDYKVVHDLGPYPSLDWEGLCAETCTGAPNMAQASPGLTSKGAKWAQTPLSSHQGTSWPYSPPRAPSGRSCESPGTLTCAPTPATRVLIPNLLVRLSHHSWLCCFWFLPWGVAFWPHIGAPHFTVAQQAS